MGRFVIVLCASLAILVAVQGRASAFPPSTGATVSPLMGITFGGAQPPSRLDDFTTTYGHFPRILMWYQDWTQPLVRPYYLDDALGRGATPIVTWEPDVAATENEVQPAYALSAIVAGKYDAYLWAQARAAASYGKPFSVRLGHEMNGDWYSWGAGLNGNTPDLYVKFWKHVVTIFRDAGATNVTWIWSPNVVGYTVRDPLAYYPGNDWVDWVGMDGYNDGRPWITFTQTFSATYARLVGLGKPMLVAETASTEGASTAAKADWIRAIAPAVQSMPAIKAVIWFDLNRPRGVWRLDNSAPAAAAFADLLTKQPNPSCPPRQWTTSCYEARSAVTTDGNINAPSR